jgi:hypothetical protein
MTPGFQIGEAPLTAIEAAAQRAAACLLELRDGAVS